MGRTPYREKRADLVREACLARLDQGRPRPSIEELCELVKPFHPIDAKHMTRIVRALVAAGEIPDGGPGPDGPPEAATCRKLFRDHMACERRIGIGGGS